MLSSPAASLLAFPIATTRGTKQFSRAAPAFRTVFGWRPQFTSSPRGVAARHRKKTQQRKSRAGLVTFWGLHPAFEAFSCSMACVFVCVYARMIHTGSRDTTIHSSLPVLSSLKFSFFLVVFFLSVFSCACALTLAKPRRNSRTRLAFVMRASAVVQIVYFFFLCYFPDMRVSSSTVGKGSQEERKKNVLPAYFLLRRSILWRDVLL